MDMLDQRVRSFGALAFSTLSLVVFWFAISVADLWSIGLEPPLTPDQHVFRFYNGHLYGSVVLAAIVLLVVLARIVLSTFLSSHTTLSRLSLLSLLSLPSTSVAVHSLMYSTAVLHVLIVLFGGPIYVYGFS
jgi:hypothetical protein